MIFVVNRDTYVVWEEVEYKWNKRLATMHAHVLLKEEEEETKMHFISFNFDQLSF